MMQQTCSESLKMQLIYAAVAEVGEYFNFVDL